MQSIGFTDDMTKTRFLIRWTTVLLLVLAIASVLMILLGGEPLYHIITIVAAVGSAIFVLTLAFLGFYYLSRAQVRQKRKLLRQISRSKSGLAKAQEALSGAAQHESTLRDLARQRQEAERVQFETLTRERNNKIEELRVVQEQELAAALAELGNAHVAAGLRATPLDLASIPGVDAALADKLQAAGIRTAHDISQEAVQGIEGVNESQALALVQWRSSLEGALAAARPQALPQEKREAIEQRYHERILALRNEQSVAQAAYETKLAGLRADESKGTAAAAAEATSARQNLSALETHLQESKAQAELYKRITFPRFLLTALDLAPAHWGKRALSHIVLLGYFLSGIANIVALLYTLVSQRL